MGEVLPRNELEAAAWAMLLEFEWADEWSREEAWSCRETLAAIREFPGVPARERCRMVAWCSREPGWEDLLNTCLRHHAEGCLCCWPGGEEGRMGWA